MPIAVAFLCFFFNQKIDLCLFAWSIVRQMPPTTYRDLWAAFPVKTQNGVLQMYPSLG